MMVVSLWHPGMELHFPNIQPSDAGVYLCTCRNLQHSNTSRAEVVVTGKWQASPLVLTLPGWPPGTQS